MTQLLEIRITHDFASAIDAKLQVDAIFIDFAKAFDRVPHNKLIEKLKSIGINSQILSWVAAYLSNRTQYVYLNKSESDRLNVFSGVPQGSVLGPLLFLVYVNDVADCVEDGVTVRLFADDCVVYTSVHDVADQVRLNSSLRNIARWCDTWDLKINTSKTNCMSVTHKRSPLQFNYTLNGSEVFRTNSIKYLGITITHTLKWDVHIENTCTKAFRQLCFIRRKLSRAPPHVKLTAYKTLVRPILEYGSIVWNPHQQYLVHKLKKMKIRHFALFTLHILDGTV